MTININGIDVNYKLYEAGTRDQGAGTGEQGSGTWAVVLEGWNTSIPVYDYPAKLLAERWPTVVFDLPGFGLTPEPPEAWTTAGYADFVRDFIAALGIKSVVLWGHSFGGKLAIRLGAAEDLPFTIEKIVLNDAAGIVRKKTARQKFRAKKYKALRKLFETKCFRYFYPDALGDLRARYGSADYNSATPLMRDVLVKHVNEDISELLPLVRPETLLIWGRDDTATTAAAAEKMDSLIPNSGLAFIEGAGHYCFLDNPSLYKAILNAFISP